MSPQLRNHIAILHIPYRQGIDGVDWVIEYIIFLHIQCEAIAIYMHVLSAHIPNTPSSCFSSTTYHFRKSASQTSDRLLSAHLYMYSQEFIISLTRS